MAAPHVNQVINSYNLFIDSTVTGGSTLSQGDNAQISLGADAISCGNGQLLRISLTSFALPTVLFNVNINNNRYRLTTNFQATELTLQPKYYESIGDITQEFVTSLAAQLKIDTGVDCSPQNVTPLGTLFDTGDHVLSAEFHFNSPHGLTNFNVQCFEEVSDSYILLGCNKITDPASVTPSFTCTIVSTTVIQIQGFYPMQRASEEYVYLRIGDFSTNIQTLNLAGSLDGGVPSVIGSNILAAIPIDSGLTSYEASTRSEYSCLLQKKKLASIRLFLTDSRNRPLGRMAGSTTHTASGRLNAQGLFVSPNQASLGNLRFRAVLRVDIVQTAMPPMLNAPIPDSYPVSKVITNNPIPRVP